MSYPTWSDLSSESIVPPFGARRAKDIGPVAVMISCEPDFKYIQSRTAVEKAVPFFTSTLMTPSGGGKGTCVVGPFIGSPYAVMLLESLIARGAERLMVVGWCGAVTDDLAVGDILIPDKAIVDEGTSMNYRALDETVPISTPHEKMAGNLSDHLVKEGIPFQKGIVWTTDAIYRETEKKVAHFRGLGAIAVEMECSALFSAAAYRRVEIAALLIVSDSVASRDWEPGFRHKRFKQARHAACNAVMSFAQSLSDHD